MSTNAAGLFVLMANQGKQDTLLNATEQLNEKLKQYVEENKLLRESKGIPATEYGNIGADITCAYEDYPRIAQIERSHIVYMQETYKPHIALGYEYYRVNPVASVIKLGSTITFELPQFGDFIMDIVLHMNLKGLRPASSIDRVRYAQKVGLRIQEKVTFKVNGNILDEVVPENYNFYDKTQVPPHKQDGWNRCIGQEVPKTAYMTQDPLSDEYRECKFICDGPQTLKTEHKDLELWIPQLLWFCQDPRQSFPSVSIPQGQRTLIIELAEMSKICAAANYGGGGKVIEPTIETCELYVNNLFVSPEIHDIFIRRISFSLIRIHKTHKIIVNKPNDSISLNELKFPTESLYIAFRPMVNDNSIDHWHKGEAITEVAIKVPAVKNVPLLIPPSQLVISFCIVENTTPVVDTLGFKSSTIQIYKDATPASFYNCYTPLQYDGLLNNGKLFVTPYDKGIFYIPFNIYAGGYNPSGHINFSRSRENFLNYTSSYISPTNPAWLIVEAKAINFLLVVDSGMVLRYST